MEAKIEMKRGRWESWSVKGTKKGKPVEMNLSPVVEIVSEKLLVLKDGEKLSGPGSKTLRDGTVIFPLDGIEKCRLLIEPIPFEREWHDLGIIRDIY